MINDQPYPAGPDFMAVYVVSVSDGTNLTIDCRYNSSITTASWELVRTDFDGPVRPNPGPAPNGDLESLLRNTPDTLTTWAADGTTLRFFDVSPQLEGLYRCSAAGVDLQILFTFGI